MLSDKFIATQKQLLNDLGVRLSNEVVFSQQFLDLSKRSDIEKRWMSNVRDSCNYGVFLIKIFTSSIEDYKHLPENQLGYYVAKIAIQPFLEIINSFEQIINSLIGESDEFRSNLENKVEKKTRLLEDSWKVGTKGKSKKLKKEISNSLRRKINEMAFIRDTLLAEEIIDKVDYEILVFAWDIRNSMHTNYTAIKDINFTYPDIKTGKRYSFTFAKGEELYHPKDLISYYVVTEQIIFILLKILQKFSNEA